MFNSHAMSMLRLLTFIGCALAALALACGAPSLALQGGREFWAFTGPWDPASNNSVRNFGGRLDAVITGWIALDSVTARPLLPSAFPDTLRPRAGAPQRMALVTSWHGDRFHTGSIRKLARDRALLGRTAATIAAHARTAGYRGLVLDFEALERSDLEGLIRVVGAIADSARRTGIRPIALAIPATDTAAYPARALLRVADYLVVMLYDQHWSGSQPGPISSPAWVRESLALRIAEAGPNRLIAGLPVYGYRWRLGATGEPIGFPDAQRAATAARTSLQRDRASNTLRARSASWELWVTDVELLEALVRQVESTRVRRFALWRLGQEDPRIWGRVIR
jgi:spore germination protein YaaH